jgi:ankyrin repeat protein
MLFALDKKGRTALDWARMTRRMETVGYLTHAMSEYLSHSRLQDLGVDHLNTSEGILKENEKMRCALVDLLKKRDADGIMKLLAENIVSRDAVADFPSAKYFCDAESPQGDTPLILAAGYNMISVVSELIATGCAVDTPNKHGHTALTWACLCGHGEMVRTLLLLGADLNHQTKEGRDGLHYACMYAKARVVCVIMDVLYERFGAWRSAKHPVSKFDPSRWTKYSAKLEEFLKVPPCRKIYYLLLANSSILPPSLSAISLSDPRCERRRGSGPAARSRPG